ncbi:MAG: RNA polymerase sigma factor [Verrucomicrobiota bacterium]
MNSQQALQLLPRLQAGDPDAWDEAFELLYPLAFHSAQKASSRISATDAEDIAIETLSQLVKQIHQIKDWNGIQAMTATIAIRTGISFIRKAVAQKRGSGQVESLDFLRETTGDLHEPATGSGQWLCAVDLNELSQLLATLTEKLPEESRQIIIDFTINSLSYQELSEKYHKPMGTIGVQLSRSFQKLRQHLEHHPEILKEVREFLR